MIKTKTVLVLGAGASADYGYPLGRELVDWVIQTLRDPGMLNLMSDCGVERRNAEELRNALGETPLPSIDAFIERRPEYADAARMAIALALAPCEEHRKLSLFRGDPRWYEHLVQSLDGPEDAFLDNQLSIVTFNYDRSLDHYLFTTVKSMYGLSYEDCAALIQRFHLVHVYGQIDLLPWQTEATTGGRRYGDRIEHSDSLIRAASSLHTIQDGLDYAVLRKARGLIAGAEEVLFLGFGYVPENVERLQIDAYNARYRGTAYKMAATQLEAVQQRWKEVEIPDSNVDIMGFFRNYVRLQ